MANHASAKKRARTALRRGQINKSRTSRMRTFLKKVETALEGGKADEAAQALKSAQPEIYRSVAKGLIHRNTAARKMSRLSARIKALASSA